MNDSNYGSNLDSSYLKDVSTDELIEKQIEISIKQSESAGVQFKTTLRLTYLIIAISIFSVIPILRELFYPNQNKILFERILKLEEEKSQNTEIISQMSIHLLDLQNQVQILGIKKEIDSLKVQ